MVDIPYAREVSGARESKVIKLSHTLLHLSHATLQSPPDAINCPFPMAGCELVVGDGEVDVLLVKGNRQHGDAIQEESLLEMLSSAVREEMEVVQSWI